MRHTKKMTDIFYWILFAGIVFWFAYTKGWILADFPSIQAKEALILLEQDENVTLLDVRTIPEYKEGHLRNATLIPLDALEDNLGMLAQDKNKKIVVYCHSGNRSIAASRILKAHGFTPVNIKGGLIDLTEAKAEIIK
ncbi:MAG: hypothetical protein RL113_1428 [Pseudomonadota bacterium]|jgi:rhodanese-related sulfurtransferase